MKPIDFVVFDGNSSPNLPVYQLAEAMNKPLVIRSEKGEMEVLSYYFSNGRMVIDVGLIE